MFGLNSKTIGLIKGVFLKYPSVENVKIFGSRALKKNRPNSDIDLALFGAVDLNLVSHISSELDELPTPYIFDVVNYKDIQNKKLTAHIDKYGKSFYLKSI